MVLTVQAGLMTFEARPRTACVTLQDKLMLHRHLNHSEWTLAAIDDVIARGRLDDWKELRDVAATRIDIRKRILLVAKPHLSDPYAQRYHFWNLYVRKQSA